MPEFILILALLTTESSYQAEIERPAAGVVDTVQFWVGPAVPSRIRTYAIDHDIHVYSLGARPDGSLFEASEAQAHIRKHYSDILGTLYVLKFKDPGNADEVSRVFAANGLAGTLEIAPAGFAFYNPDRGTYRTQSRPK
jgi:hypothetical protein